MNKRPPAGLGPIGHALGTAATRITLAVLVALALLVPVFSLWVPAGSALHLPDYAVPLLGKYLCYALLALSLDLVWGYCGILSLGHCAFFALGAYAMGMYLMRQIGTRGVYGDPVLPDFMVFLNWKELPWFWHGFDQFWYSALMILAVPGALAALFGWFAFRSRVTGVYLSIITQALTYALLLAFFRNDMGFGGNNGLTDFKEILGFDIQSAQTRAGLFAATALLLAAALAFATALVGSRFGAVLVCVRDAESRVRFLGYRPERFKLLVWTVSAMLAGLAGALYVPQVGIVNPGEFDPGNSIEAVIWVAVGGRSTLVGAIVGAVIVNFGKTVFTAVLPELWLFALAALFVGVTLFLPRGIMGLAAQWRARAGRRRPAVAVDLPADLPAAEGLP
jgi:urea transport system permease protein